jgi:hypothetical protein
MKRVINFSGGKTSALMTILLKPTEDDYVIFCDTGREHPLTYKFIDDFERNEGIKVHRLVYVNKKQPDLKGFEAMNKSKVYLPNRVRRICTNELKVNVAKRFLRPLIGMAFEQYIGFRADEESRVKNFRPSYIKSIAKFPLYDQGIDKEMVNQYWLMKPYTLEVPSILGNCDLCFLKGKNAIIRILQMYPGLADKWIADEEEMTARKNNGPARYFSDITYRQLLNIAKSQKTLFDLQTIEPAFNCACTA